MQAVRQVVFTDVLIVGRLDVDGQSFAPIGLHKIDAASDWLFIKRKACRKFRYKNNRTTAAISVILAFTGERMFLFQLKIRGASEKFKNQPRPLLRPTSVNFWQYCRNISHATVPLR